MPKLSSEAWMAEILLLPKSRRPWVRNFTIRRARPELGEVDIEFALHGDTPASAWARRAQPGDPAGIFDMGVTYLPPAHAEWQLLAGDESAVPAILAILEHAPASLAAEVFLEVPETADIRADITAPEGVRVRWLARDGADALPGRLVLDAVRTSSPRPGRFYTWVAGEAGMATGVRRHLVRDRGVPKPDIAFFGYWRHGRSSPADPCRSAGAVCSHRWPRVVLDATSHLTCALRRGQPGDQVQRHVDTGRDPGGGDHVTVVDEPLVGPYVDRRVELREQVQRPPMRGRGPPGRGTGGGRRARSPATRCGGPTPMACATWSTEWSESGGSPATTRRTKGRFWSNCPP
ncbi:hypothetical protein SANTM175S_03721 [Streptomyces antimycoticus]